MSQEDRENLKKDLMTIFNEHKKSLKVFNADGNACVYNYSGMEDMLRTAEAYAKLDAIDAPYEKKKPKAFQK